jgi:hypothetical protein
MLGNRVNALTFGPKAEKSYPKARVKFVLINQELGI